MLTVLYQCIRRNTNTTSLVLLAIFLVICMTGFHFRKRKLGKVPDKMCYFNAVDFKEFICKSPEAWYVYASTQATFDVLFPITYCTLTGMLIVGLFDQTTATRLLVLPLLVFITDLSENAVTIYLAFTFDCNLEPPTIPWLAIVLTPTKWLLIGSTVITIIVAGLINCFTFTES